VAQVNGEGGCRRTDSRRTGIRTAKADEGSPENRPMKPATRVGRFRRPSVIVGMSALRGGSEGTANSVAPRPPGPASR
jgi:hypothetical protein